MQEVLQVIITLRVWFDVLTNVRDKASECEEKSEATVRTRLVAQSKTTSQPHTRQSMTSYPYPPGSR